MHNYLFKVEFFNLDGDLKNTHYVAGVSKIDALDKVNFLFPNSFTFSTNTNFNIFLIGSLDDVIGLDDVLNSY